MNSKRRLAKASAAVCVFVLRGRRIHFWIDDIYFSFVTYTTVGYGDLVPVGPIRFIGAGEACRF